MSKEEVDSLGEFYIVSLSEDEDSMSSKEESSEGLEEEIDQEIDQETDQEVDQVNKAKNIGVQLKF
ncbi:hypothetical protein BLOT_009244 [Blomia tropicalis]|nr:hypothetical protein BLOT_009244 [Blomia tropicalis]